MTCKFKVGDWVVRKREYLNHPFWYKWGYNPIQIESVSPFERDVFEVSFKESEGNSWLSTFFNLCFDPDISTNLEDYL